MPANSAGAGSLSGSLLRWFYWLLNLSAAGAALALTFELAPALGLHVEAAPILAIFVSAALGSVAGFAFSAIAAAILSHMVPETVHALQIMLVASIALQTYSLVFLWRSVRIRFVLEALLGGILCMPIGLYLLLSSTPDLYRLSLGLFIAVYCILSLFKPSDLFLPNRGIVRFLVGGLGGITGPTAAFPGALPVVWASLTTMDKKEQRAFYQPYILAMQIVTLVALGATGSPAPSLSEDALFVIPALCGAHLGLFVFRSLSSTQFTLTVNGFLMMSAFGLIVRSLT